MSNKKFIASTITAAAVAAAFVPAASADEVAFSDVSDRYADAVNFLVGNGITSGKSTTTFGTSEEISRVDAAVLIANVLGADKDATYEDSGFTDVPTRAKWAVDALTEWGIINGFDGDTFGSHSKLSRSQAALILANAAELDVNENVTKTKFSDVNERFAPYVDALVKAGITSGKTDTQFGANDNVKRGEMALFIERAKEHFGYMNLMVMHTNDTHAYLDNAPLRATTVKEIRAAHDNTLLLDAGDVFSGDLHFNKYRGKADLAFMNYMGYDGIAVPE